MTSTATYPIDVASTEDLPSILDLMKSEYVYPYTDADYWHWRYFDNPVAEVQVYVARNEQGEVISLQAVSAYKFVVSGEVRKAHLFTGAITHPDYRRLGLFRSLVKEITEDLRQQGDYIIFTFPNENSVQGFRRFDGWKQQELLSLHVRPLSPLPSFSSGNRAANGNILISETSRFETSTDALLRKSFVRSGTFVDRSREYLKWRYADNPTSSYTILTAHTSDEELAGYVVLKEYPFLKQRSGLIIDLVASNDQACKALVNEAVRVAQSSGFRVLAYLVGKYNPYGDTLRDSGFFSVPPRLSPRQFYLYTYAGSDLSTSLGRQADEVPWYVTWGDNDVV